MCASAPVVGDAVEVIVGDVVAKVVTDDGGRAIVSLASLWGGTPASTRRQVVVRHTGTPDVVLEQPSPAQ